MPDVGVLELQIRDDSKEAGKGLVSLAGALERVKSAVDGFSLSAVRKEISDLSSGITSQKGASTTVKNLASLFNAISKFSKIKGFNIDKKPFENLKSAIGDGFKIGTAGTQLNQLREAMSGDWGDGSGIESIKNLHDTIKDLSIGEDSKKIKDLTVAVKEYGEAAKKTKENSSASGDWRTAMSSGSTMSLNLQQFASKPSVEGLQQVESTIQQTTQAIIEQNNAIKEDAGVQVFKSKEEVAKAMGISVEEATKRMNELYNMVYKTSSATPVYSSLEDAAKDLGISLEEVKQKVVGVNDTISGSSNTQDSFLPTDMFIQTYSHIDYLKSKLQDLKADLDMRRKVGLIDADDIDKSVMEIKRLQDEIKKLEDKANEAIPTAHKFSDAWKAFSEGIKKTFPSIGGLLKRFAQIAKYRMLRAVLKHITEGFREGVENVYRYSQAVGTSFAPTMDRMASTMAQFKNSIGAAAAPVLQALIPILNSIANAAISVINVFNQLFAMLGGQSSWTRALPVAAQAFDDTKKAASGAGSAVKEMLAAFDELNVISSESGGGGGGGSSALADYESMFEEMYSFDEKIRQFVDWLNDNMESIKGIAIAIGTAILGWRLSEAFSKVLPALSKIFGFVATGAVIAITLQLNWLLTNQYLNTGEVGWLFADILTTAVGATVAATLAKKLIGGANTAAYTAAITLTLSAVTGIVALIQNTNVDAFSKESIFTALENALKAGAAVGILLKAVGGAALSTSILGAGVAAMATFGVVVALKASLDPKVQLFSPVYLLTAVGSAVLAGFGTFLFTSSLPAAGIAALLTFGALIAIKLFTNSSNIEWGNEHLTDRQVENFVEKKMFKIDVKASIERINTTVEATAFNRTELEKELSSLLGDMNLIKLGIADDQDYAEMQKKVDSIVTRVHGMAESADNLAKLTLQFTPSLVGDTAEEQGDWFSSYTKGWDKVDEWFQAKGKELGQYITTNEKGEIIASKPELIKEVLQQVTDVLDAVNNYKVGKAEFSELLLGIGDLDKASAEKVIEKYETYIADLRTALENSAKEQLLNQESLVALLYKIDPNSPEYYEAVAELERMTQNLVDGVEKDLEEAIGPGRDLILEWIFKNHSKGSIDTTWTEDYLRQNILDGLTEALNLLLEEGGVDPLEIEAMNMIGFTGWDLLAEDLQKKIIQYSVLRPDTMQALKDELKIDANTVISMSGWEAFEEREKLQFINSMAKVYGPSAMEQIKDKIGNIKVSDLISTSGWTQWSTEEQKQYIKSLKAAYGSYAVQNALIGLGKNVPDWIAKGMEKRDELNNALKDISKELEEAGITNQDILADWDLTAPIVDKYNVTDSAKIITDIIRTCGTDSKTILRNWNLVAPEVSGLSLQSSLNAAKQIAQQTGIDLNTIIEHWNLIAPHIDESNINSSAKSISDTIKTNRENWVSILAEKMNAPDLRVPKGWGDYIRVEAQLLAREIKQTVEAINPKIKVDTSVVAVIEAIVNVVPTVGTVISGVTKGVKTVVESVRNFGKGLGWYASGAYDIPNGQIFVAGEDGPELIGTLNGNTTVANQGQIIEGIAAGVAASNEEQNVLLREQNNLLRQILAKDNSVRLGASSALGRTVKQSLEMYGSMAGG